MRISKLILIPLVVMISAACTPMNKDDVKSVAENEWLKHGFEITGYEGYQWGLGGVAGYGGAKVWYRLKKVQDNGITYSGYLLKWGDEYHTYNLSAIDAIKP